MIYNDIKIIGDPHLGRKFIRGVPLHRRGEREKMQRQAFLDALYAPQDINVCIGDIFDTFAADYNTLLWLTSEYRACAHTHQKKEFYILRGNHDISKDLGKISAFDVFQELVIDVENINVMEIPDYVETPSNNLCFLPWDPIRSAREQVELLISQFDSPEGCVFFTHMDLDSFGGDDHNLMPYDLLESLKPEAVFNGHVHKPEKRIYSKDLVIHNVGSLQPYAHGEEVDDSLYVTVDLATFELDPAAYKNRCVRILLSPGETLPEDIDVLQLTVKRITEVNDEEIDEVEIEDFDFNVLFMKKLSEAGVNKTIVDELWASFANQNT